MILTVYLYFANQLKNYYFAEYLLDLSLMDMKMVKYLPSEIAAAAIWIGIKVCEQKNMISEIIEYSRSNEEQIQKCASDLIQLCQKYEKHSLKTRRNK